MAQSGKSFAIQTAIYVAICLAVFIGFSIYRRLKFTKRFFAPKRCVRGAMCMLSRPACMLRYAATRRSCARGKSRHARLCTQEMRGTLCMLGLYSRSCLHAAQVGVHSRTTVCVCVCVCGGEGWGCPCWLMQLNSAWQHCCCQAGEAHVGKRLPACFAVWPPHAQASDRPGEAPAASAAAHAGGLGVPGGCADAPFQALGSY